MAVSLSMEITQNSQNATNNTSNITVKTIITWNYGSWNATGECYGSITINGTVYNFTGLKFNTSATTSGSQTIMTKTVDVSHNADGTKTVEASTSFYTGISSQGTKTTSASKVLTTIVRATTPTLSAASMAMGSAVTINTPRALSSFTHTLTYTFGSASGTIATGVATSYKWTIPLSFANQIPNATSGTGTITCKTYNGTTLVGTKTVTFTATVPSSVVPSISAISLSDPNGYAVTYNGYVRTKSKIKVAVTSTGSYSSTIKKTSITVNNTTVTTNPYTSNVITVAPGSQTVSVTVTDSRGRTATKTATYTVLAYTSPTITTLTAIRCNSDGTANENGAYMKITYAGSITSLSSKNTKSFSVQYKLQSATSWTTAASSTSAYSVSSSVVKSASTESSYDIRMVATDAFGSSTTSIVLGTAFTLINFNKSGKGMAIGKVSETDRTFEVGLPLIGKQITTENGVDLDLFYKQLTTITETSLSGDAFNTYFSTIDINRLIRVGLLLKFEFRGLLKADVPNNTAFTFTQALANANPYDATIEAYTSNRYMTTTPVRRFAYFNDSNTIRLGGGFTSGSWVHMNGIAILKSL